MAEFMTDGVFLPAPNHSWQSVRGPPIYTAWKKTRPWSHRRGSITTFFRRRGRCPNYTAWNQDCSLEWDEWLMVDALVSPSHCVLEVGARFGTTSCMLSRATNNSGKVIAVEPDRDVHTHLQSNRARHCCNFHVDLLRTGSIPIIWSL